MSKALSFLVTLVWGEKVPYPYGRSNPIHKRFQNIYPGSPQTPGKKKETGEEEEYRMLTSS